MTPKQARLGVNIFTGLVVASVGLALAGLTWRLQGHPGIGPVAAPVAPGTGNAPDIRPILALAPFGTVMAVPVEGGDGAVRLQGILAAIPMEASVALIATADGGVQAYGLGEAVGGGIIEAILPLEVVLRTSTGLQSLAFDPDFAGGAGGFAGSGSAPATGRTPPPSRPARAPNASGVDAIRALLPGSARGGQEAAPSAPAPPPSSPPVSAAPTASGHRIGNSAPPAMLAAGIRPGDVIQRVNGRAVTDGISERELMAQAMAGESVRLDLIRDGKRVSLTVAMR